MLKHLLKLPDGSQIGSGETGAAVTQVKLTRSVNDARQLQPGSACSAMLEVRLWDVEPGRICAGDALTLVAVDEGGNQRTEGIFLAEEPQRLGAHTLRITAYDRLTLLDRDLGEFLASLDGWPYPLERFAAMVCQACGLELLPGAIPNGEFPVEQFSGWGMTGRQLMMWIGQVSCRFCRATPEGDVELAWYTPASLEAGADAIYMAQAHYHQEDLQLTVRDGTVSGAVSLTAPSVSLRHDGQGNVTLQLGEQLYRKYCFRGGMTLADYQVAPVEKVQLQQDAQDVGTVYPPDDPSEKNTFRITGNPLLSARSAQALTPVAQTLLPLLQAVSYTPGTLELPASQPIDPGSILSVTDASGQTRSFYVMTSERTGQREVLTCVGSRDRDSTTAFNDAAYAPMSGKVLHLRADVDGLLADNADNQGRLSRLELDVTGIRGEVQSQQSQADQLQTRMTQLAQTADSVSATVRTITQQGTTRVESAFGLTVDGSAVQICRSGSDMKNRLDEKGMYIVRGAGTGNEVTMLRADANGVLATDVTVRNYLCIGEHSRIEDYTDGTDHRRTACYFTGG